MKTKLNNSVRKLKHSKKSSKRFNFIIKSSKKLVKRTSKKIVKRTSKRNVKKSKKQKKLKGSKRMVGGAATSLNVDCTKDKPNKGETTCIVKGAAAAAAGHGHGTPPPPYDVNLEIDKLKKDDINIVNDKIDTMVDAQKDFFTEFMKLFKDSNIDKYSKAKHTTEFLTKINTFTEMNPTNFKGLKELATNNDDDNDVILRLQLFLILFLNPITKNIETDNAFDNLKTLLITKTMLDYIAFPNLEKYNKFADKLIKFYDVVIAKKNGT